MFSRTAALHCWVSGSLTQPSAQRPATAAVRKLTVLPVLVTPKPWSRLCPIRMLIGPVLLRRAKNDSNLSNPAALEGNQTTKDAMLVIHSELQLILRSMFWRKQGHMTCVSSVVIQHPVSLLMLDRCIWVYKPIKH